MSATRVDEAGARATVVLGVVALLLAVTGLSAVTATGLAQPSIAIGFGVFVALGEFARVTLPNDREVAPIGAAGALAYALLIDLGDRPAEHVAHQVVAVTAVATLVGALPHVVVGRAPRVDVLARRVIVVAVVASAFRNEVTAGLVEPLARWQVALVLVGLAVLAGAVDALLGAAVRASATRAPFWRTLLDDLAAVAALGSAVGATAVLVVISAEVMSFWALPTFCVLLLLTQFSFKRYSTIRNTYRQTIRSLSKVTEVGGYTPSGHARRVCDMSLAVGRELGLSESRLLDLEYAALMHDIGQLSLVDPIPRGATALTAPDDQRRLAEKGAEVIRQTGVLDRVADIVARQAEPYRRPGEATDPTLPLESRIIRAANAFDDMVGGAVDPGPRLAALERLRLSMAYDYDPRVVETLSRVVERSTLLRA